MLYLRTVARMKPSMVASRLRGMRTLPRSFDEAQAPGLAWPAIAVPALDLDPAYRARFDLVALERDEFLLINERHAVDLSAWQAPEASHLWNFNLHYFEYCVPLAARYRERRDPADYAAFRRLVTEWMAANPYAQGDGWHPYTTSLRLINWLICADLFRPALQDDPRFADAMRRSMYRQYRHLLLNQETHLLANHYFENLKTLLVCAWAFGEDDVAARVQRDLEAQLDEQILPDGVHFERSLMYHKLILEGLLRVALAARATGHEPPAALPRKAQQMRTPWPRWRRAWARPRSSTTPPTASPRTAPRSSRRARRCSACAPTTPGPTSPTPATTSCTTATWP